MFQQEILDIKHDEMLVSRRLHLARKTKKLMDWLKLLTLFQDNHDFKGKDNIILQMHDRFILDEHFWIIEINRKFKSQSTFNQSSIDFAMLALDDGFYMNAAKLIQEELFGRLLNKQLRVNYVIAKMERLIDHFGHEKASGGYFFAKLREVYVINKDDRKIRSCYFRQLRSAFDNYDVVYDEYSHWQKEEKPQQEATLLYAQAKIKWHSDVINLQENVYTQHNIKCFLTSIQNQNKSDIDQHRYMLLIEKLQNEQQKIWFLRRMALSYKQMIPNYAFEIELIWREDEQTIINKFKTLIDICDDLQIQLKYIYFLIRRFNKHLLETQPNQYNQAWAEKVSYFRAEITNLIQKTRLNSIEQTKITEKYYMLWIEVEEHIIKDKNSVSQLYQAFLKLNNNSGIFQNYIESMKRMGAYGDARNIFKRLHAAHQLNPLETTEKYQRFLGIYGTIDQQSQFQKQKIKNYNLTKNSPLNDIKNSPTSTGLVEIEKRKLLIAEKEIIVDLPLEEAKHEAKKRAREVYDQIEEKIESGVRKKLHVDSESTVFVKGIDPTWKESDVLSILKYPKNVSEVRLVFKFNTQRDYCYIQYDDAEIALKEVNQNIDSKYKFAISKPPAHYDESKTLFLCALPPETNSDKIKQLFPHPDHIKEIRLKMDKDKNYAYVDFHSLNDRDLAFEKMYHQKLTIDGKKILLQKCDSDRNKNKKFIKVVILKDLAFKATENDLRDFFAGKGISKISIPRVNNRSKGYAFVEFQKFKDYQQILDSRVGVLHGRQFHIFKSDRQITQEKQRPEEQAQNNGVAQKQHSTTIQQSQKKYRQKQKQKPQSNGKETDKKDNHFFSSLFK